MLSKPEARQAILNLVVAHYPREAWPAMLIGTSWAYQEAWTSTRDDPRFGRIPGQRRFRAAQERHFLMENSLAQMADQAGLPYAGEVVRSNQWAYGMIRTPGLCLMQKRVQQGGEPPPADFRKQIAAANSFARQGDLLVLGDHHAVKEQPLHGILIHATESQKFSSDGYGRAAFVRLAVPFGDYSGWAVILDLREVMAAYPGEGEAGKPPATGPAPTWKQPGEQDKDEKSGRG